MEMPQKIADRIKALEKITSANGSRPNAALTKRLGHLRTLHADWRDRLAHATSAVHLDAERKWIWHTELPRLGQTCDKVGVTSKTTAMAFEKDLATSVDWLVNQLSHLKIEGCY